MTERLTYSIYRIVSVGLFSSHQLTFSFLLCASIMRANTQGVDTSQMTPSPVPSVSAGEEASTKAKVSEDIVGDKDGAGEGVQVGFWYFFVIFMHVKHLFSYYAFA